MITALLLQAVAGPVLPPKPPRHDVPCAANSEGGEIVVCARPNDAYRLKSLPDRADDPAIPKAEIGLGAGRLAAEAEQATLASGTQSQRLMIRWKLPLGRKR